MRLPRIRRRTQVPSTQLDDTELVKAEADIIQKARRLLRLEAEAGVQSQPFFLRERRRPR